MVKMLPVTFRPAAADDLEEIFLFILERSQHHPTAKDFTDRIVTRCEKIGNAPNGGVARDDLGKGLRLVPFEKTAVIVYQVQPAAIQIVNIFYGGRDYEALMGS